jgi:hypothetical protein
VADGGRVGKPLSASELEQDSRLTKHYYLAIVRVYDTSEQLLTLNLFACKSILLNIYASCYSAHRGGESARA